jgi:guanyl-specific ribonuclease Sa
VFPAYNFEVADFHTYFVGDDGAWVHNSCGRLLPFSDPNRVREVNKTLDRIERGGPFPFAKDGTAFKNREGLLPANGNYTEFTVVTPGAGNRAARRVVVDGNSGRKYYSDDHYKSFIQIE